MPNTVFDFLDLEPYGVADDDLFRALHGAPAGQLPDDLKAQLRDLLEQHGFMLEEAIRIVPQPNRDSWLFDQRDF